MGCETFSVRGKDIVDCMPELTRVSAKAMGVDSMVHLYVPHKVLDDFERRFGYEARACELLQISTHYEFVDGTYVGVLHSDSQILPMTGPPARSK